MTSKILVPLILVLLLASAVVACGNLEEAEENLDPPTPNAAFVPSESTATPRPTLTRAPTVTPGPTATPVVTRTITIFDEELHPDWELAYSHGLEFEEQQRFAFSGSRAIALTPLGEGGRLRFTLRENADLVLRRDDVFLVRFWLNSGSDVLETGDLGLIVPGSNALTYFDPTDTSVETRSDCGPFCLTRLYFLGFNRPVPVGSWYPIELVVSDLQKDTFSTYITGVIIGTGEEIFQTVYIDKVEIVLFE